MGKIVLNTFIPAPANVCFDLARSVDVHVNSMAENNERVVSGKLNGLLQHEDIIEWNAKHFGIGWRMRVKISAMTPGKWFIDEMVQGPFAMMKHKHEFISLGNTTLMRDVFIFRAPLGWLGRLVDTYILTPYLTSLLKKRNEFIRTLAS